MKIMKKTKVLVVLIVSITVAIIIALSIIGLRMFSYKPDPESRVTEYFGYLANGEYDNMYELLETSSKQSISKEDFVSRNKNIYTGIEATNITISNLQNEDLGNVKLNMICQWIHWQDKFLFQMKLH